jgi:hypothetical protein
MGRSGGPRICHDGWAVLPKGRSRKARANYAARAGVALDALDVDPMAPSGEPVREFERDSLAALTLDPGGTGNSLSAEDFYRLRGRLMVKVSDRTGWWDVRPYTGPVLACREHQRADRSEGAAEARSADAPSSAAPGTSGSEATADDETEPGGSAPADSDSDPSIADQQQPAAAAEEARGKTRRSSPQRRNRHPRENRMH